MRNTLYIDLSQRQRSKPVRLPLYRGYTRTKAGDQRPAPVANNFGNAAPTVLTIPEACAALKVSKWTIYQLIRSRQLGTMKIGSRRVVPLAAIEALIERLQAEEAA